MWPCNLIYENSFIFPDSHYRTAFIILLVILLFANAIYRKAFLSIWEADLHKYIVEKRVILRPLVHSHFSPDSAVTGCHAASSVQGCFSTGTDWWGGLDWAGWADPGKWPPDQFQYPQNQAYEANQWKLLSWGHPCIHRKVTCVSNYLAVLR